MHIGLIGGIGPAATEFYYRGLIDQYAQANAVLDLTIVHADVREMSRNMANGEAQKQAAAFAALLRRLSAAGAELAAVTSMGGHFCIGELAAMSPLPLLNAIPLVAAEIRRRKVKTVGILGTSMVMQTRLYGAIASAAVVAPDGEALAEVHRNYAEMATVGRVSRAQQQAFFDAGKALHQDRGAEVVLLAGTDLFLAFQGVDCGFPVLDCAQIHLDALCQSSLGG